MADIFISYRRADQGFGNWIATVLKRQFAIFYDKGTIEPGDHFPSEITEAIIKVAKSIPKHADYTIPAICKKLFLEQKRMDDAIENVIRDTGMSAEELRNTGRIEIKIKRGVRLGQNVCVYFDGEEIFESIKV